MSDPHPNGPSAQGPGPAGPGDLQRWLLAAIEDLDVDPDAFDMELLLDLARDVAHQVARPAVPLTSFLVGYAVASGGGDRATLERVLAQVAGLVEAWPAAPEPGTDPSGSAAP